MAGSYGEVDAAGIVDSSHWTLGASYYPGAVDDTHGPYDLAPFLTRSSNVTVGLSRAREEMAPEGYIGGSPGFVNRIIELYSRYTTEIAEWSVEGRYVWRESGWFAGGSLEGSGAEESTSKRDVQSSGYRAVGGKYLGDTTTLEVTVGTGRDRQDPAEVVCEAFGRRCYGLVSTDTHTDEAGVAVRHVGELWGRTYSVGAGVRSSWSEHRKVGPRLLDPDGRPITLDPPTGRPFAVKEGELLYSDESRLYNIYAALFPTPALGVRLSYVKLKQDEFGDADGIGLSTGWFFRRNLSGNVSFSRTRLDGALDPRFRDSDNASIRLLVRF